MSQSKMILGNGTVSTFRDIKIGDEVVTVFESSNSSSGYPTAKTVISFDEPNKNGNIIRTESFLNCGVYTPTETYTNHLSGLFVRQSDWGTYQMGLPYVGTAGVTYPSEFAEPFFSAEEKMEKHAQQILAEILYEKIKKHEEELFAEMYGTISVWKKIECLIDRVIFNEPATIILWKDGVKTVVKTQDGEPFDKEKGFLMAIAKYLNRDKANYNNLIKKWCPEDDEDGN